LSSVNYDWTQIAKPYKLSIIGKPLSMKEAEIAFITRWYELFD
jgi:hypothetical protein